MADDLRHARLRRLVNAPWAPVRAVATYRAAQVTRRFLAAGRTASSTIISVIMPCFDAAETVRNAATSVLAQSHDNLELLLVDDASTDATRSELRALASDPRVRAFAIERNCGPSVCRNLAMEQARGAYVAFHDADDTADPDRLRIQLGAILSSPGAIASIGDAVRVSASGTPVSINGSHARLAPVTLMFETKQVLAAIGYQDSVRFGGDYEYYRRLLTRFGAHSVVRCPLPLYRAAFRPTSLTHAGAGRHVWTQSADANWTRAPSPIRDAYVNASNEWHAAGNSDLYVAVRTPSRAFVDPSALAEVSEIPELIPL